MKSNQPINPNTMKKILPLLLLFTGIMNAQILDIPDANFKAELLSSAPNREVAQDFSDNWIKIDANNDGEIQVSEAQAVKTLNISQLLIFNVNGLNGFSNLEAFNIGTSFVTTLDVSALTHLKTLACYNLQILSNLNVNSTTSLTGLNIVNLPNLTTLSLGNLINLSKLSIFGTGIVNFNANGLTSLTEFFYYANTPTTTVTVNGLTNLVKLDCAYNSNLSVLNLSGLSALTELNCSGNQLINLNGVPNVTKLNCENNKLTTLTLNGLTNLSELRCGGNELTVLNVNMLTNLTKLYCPFTKITTLSITDLPNLKTLDCGSNNELTTVSLTNLPLLEDFSVVGTVSMNGNPIGHLTSLTLSDLPNLHKLNCSNSTLTSLNLNGLTSLTEVICSRNQLTSLNVSNLPNLQKLICDTNPIESLDVSNMPNLTILRCAGGYADPFTSQIIGHLNTLNVSGSTNLKELYCDYSLLTSINLTGLINLEVLYCVGLGNGLGQLTSLDVNGLPNLKRLNCVNQNLTSLNVSNLVNLTDLYCSYNHITSLDLTGLINLKTLDYNYNQLANLNLVNLPSLTTLNCSNNQLTTLNVLNLTNLKDLNCASNQLTTLNLSGLSSLETLNFSYNQISLSNVSGLSTNLKSLYCDNNEITSLDVSNLPNLETLSCANNQLTSIDVSSLNNLKFLDISTNQLTTINISNLTGLEYLDVYQNLLTSLDLNGLTTLKQLSYSENVIPNLDVSFLINLEMLQCDNTQSTVLDVTALNKLTNLSCSYNQLTTLDLSTLNNLQYLGCNNNLITTLDVNNSPNLLNLTCGNNQLTSLFLKNGKVEQSIDFSNNPNLEYICADGSQLQTIQTQLNDLAMNATVCNSYCSFTPGGDHNTITGITIFDANNDGCDVTDEVNPFIRLNINDTSVDGATVTNINGTYNFYTDAGNYVISPNTENPTWFDFSPATATFSFLDNDNNISTQNFCITAVGVHKDIEVVFSPVEAARPGFDAKYKIVFKNKGNQMQSGTVTLQFDDARTDLVSASPDVDAIATNSLTWNFTNLMPFENRSIQLTLNINEPGDTPAVNNGDILDFTASITPIAGDEFPTDNQFDYSQTVVGSYDPNEIVCLEGTTLSPTEIGKYLHYIVNFENLGTFYAENVVVRLDIDDTKFDMNSLQLLNSSNPSSTRIVGNTVEFVLQDINLAAAAGTPPVGGHGDVLFKIKTKDNLAANDTVLQRAGIYFDYNFPVVTNDAETTFAELSNPISEFDNSIKIYPNPTNAFINISSEFGIETIELYDIQGRILETHFETSTFFKLDISSKSKGIYFLKIKTEKGSKVEKIVKE
ncbi:MAG: leucine-rich repeat domain-containing protein [Flavobacterium sp. JAD_PAG50586_2]|nr:MAG: leucine-rich repeat domain-containing protein [Flavobacterium sp. JAD_PAG50586_2]